MFNQVQDLSEHSFSRWYCRKFNFALLNRLLIGNEIGDAGKKIGVIDASFLKKSGKCTEGLGMFWNGALGKACKGLEVSTIGVVDIESNTAYGLESRLTRDGAGAESRTRQYIKQLQDAKEHLKLLGIEHIGSDQHIKQECCIERCYAR